MRPHVTSNAGLVAEGLVTDVALDPRQLQVHGFEVVFQLGLVGGGAATVRPLAHKAPDALMHGFFVLSLSLSSRRRVITPIERTEDRDIVLPPVRVSGSGQDLREDGRHDDEREAVMNEVTNDRTTRRRDDGWRKMATTDSAPTTRL